MNALDAALASRDPETMRRALEALPETALHPVAPELARLAMRFEAEDQLADALVCRDLIVRAWPERASCHLDRARLRLRMGLVHEALEDCNAAQARDPNLAGLADTRSQAVRALAGASANDTHAPAESEDNAFGTVGSAVIGAGQAGADPTTLAEASKPIRFDPALLCNPTLPADTETFRRDGVIQHLRRYSAQQHVRNALHRLHDARWLDTWANALPALRGRRVAMHGSGLGILALHALDNGAERAVCIEPSAPAARITAGIAQKHHLAAWHARHGESVRAWNEATQRASFDAFTAPMEIATADESDDVIAGCDAFAFTDLDHTLLGTGIVPALRAFLSTCAKDKTAVLLPARATVHAMAVQWCDPDPETSLDALRPLRWSPSPQPFDLPRNCWRAVTEAVVVATIDFAEFSPGQHRVELDVVENGTVDAIVFWYTAELGDTVMTTAPDVAKGTMLPACQYLDPVDVRAGDRFPLVVRIDETRLCMLGDPPPRSLRDATLPNWYLPMLADTVRDAAYRDAITRAAGDGLDDLALNPGAGCGGLALALHRAGFDRVVATERSPTLAHAGARVIADNATQGGIDLLQRDIRQLSVPSDMTTRAGMLVFDQFDCSLIGEGILHYLAHAREHFLQSGARLVPASAVLHAQLIEHRFDRLLGIDATLLNPFLHAPGFINVDADRLPWKALSEPFEVFRFDFATATPDPRREKLEIATTAPGIAGAILFWFDLELDAHTRLSNAPGTTPAAHWHQGLQFLPEARVEGRQRIPIVAEHDGSALKFGWDLHTLDRSCLLPMPRFDPRTTMAAAELEQRTRQLLQHCAQVPEERARVVDIAMRIAVDPAAHNVDPLIAQRFLALLMGH